MDGQGTKWRRKIAENFNQLSRVHERHRQTTDGRAIAYSEREREFTFAKNGGARSTDILYCHSRTSFKTSRKTTSGGTVKKLRELQLLNTKNKAIVDIRLRRRCRHLMTSTEYNVVWRTTHAATWRTVLNINLCLIVARWPHHVKTWRHPQNRMYITCRENLVKFGHVVFEICERTNTQTDRQTDIHADHNTSPSYRERSKSI